MKYYLTIIITLSLTWSCVKSESKNSPYGNPAAENFNLVDSDPRAIEIADSVVLAHGGREAWDNTNYIKWNFFGSRRHVWNKNTGDIVIEGLRDTFLIKMNLNDMTGTVNYGGEEMTHPDSLTKYLNKGKNMWINDAYWLILPFKLKDSGVTLKHKNGFPIVHDSLGRLEQLELSFENVGVTPNNKYVVTIEGESHRIHQWEFYRNATDTVPTSSYPWTDYKVYGDIVLSSGRGKYNLSEIAVGDSLASYFE